MSAHELVVDRGRDGVEIEPAALFGHAGVKDDLEQQIAQLIPNLLRLAGLDGVRNFVGLLDRVGRDRLEGLLDVPRTAALGTSEPGHDATEALDRARVVSHCRTPPCTGDTA